MALLLCASIIVLPFSACDSRIVYNETQSVENRQWNCNKIHSFEVDLQDTTQTYDFYLNFRHSINYPFRNIFFFLTTYYPDNSITRQDTIECFLADDYGNWLGKDNGDLRDVKMRFATHVHLPLSGIYRFDFQHASRDSILKDIADIGLRITTTASK